MQNVLFQPVGSCWSVWHSPWGWGDWYRTLTSRHGGGERRGRNHRSWWARFGWLDSAGTGNSWGSSTANSPYCRSFAFHKFRNIKSKMKSSMNNIRLIQIITMNFYGKICLEYYNVCIKSKKKNSKPISKFLLKIL